MIDPVRNFLRQALAFTYNASVTQITVPTGASFPDTTTEGAFNLVWWNVTDYVDPTNDPFAEIIRVTNRTGNLLTIVRGQEGTTATAKNLTDKQYAVALVPTKKTIDDIRTDIEAKQNALGFTAENVANKSTNVATDQASDTRYPSVKAVYDWATSIFQGALGYTPENIANKATTMTGNEASNTLYLSAKAIADWVVSLGYITSSALVGYATEAFVNTKVDIATASGAVIDFTRRKTFNTVASPATANITDDLTGAVTGVIQKIYHNHSSAPTVPAGWVLIGGEYELSTLNIIYAEWVSGTRVEYWIVQEQ
jgi:hypothetical protein